jgi:RimJ/RimL family protein N-acetyltransferase
VLRPWSDGDLWLLHAQNTPEALAHLGGPEPEDKVLDRHRRYLELDGAGRMYVIEHDGRTAGSIGYWDKDWEGQVVFETGWHVLPDFRGRGIASTAAREIARIAAETRTRTELHAYPPITNHASIAVCRKAGFTNRGDVDFEYPKGHWIRCQDWCLSLTTPPLTS